MDEHEHGVRSDCIASLSASPDPAVHDRLRWLKAALQAPSLNSKCANLARDFLDSSRVLGLYRASKLLGRESPLETRRSWPEVEVSCIWRAARNDTLPRLSE